MNQSYHNPTSSTTESAPVQKLVPIVVPGAEAIVVQVYSALLDLNVDWVPTWLVVRAMDDRGAGWVDTTWEELAGLRACHPRTIRRHVKAGMGVGFRSWVTMPGKGIRIYYSGIKPVCKHFGVSDLGGISYELSTSLTRSGAKACATAVLAQALQRQALHCARKDAPKGQKKKVLDARKFIQPTCDNSLRAKRPKHFFLKDGLSCPGASIASIAAKSNVSEQTVKKRLSNNFRLKQGLDLIQKRRVATLLPFNDQIIYSEHAQSFIDRSQTNWFGKVQYNLIKFIDGIAYRLGVNVYETSYNLRSCRFLRSRIKQFVLG